ncbi:YbfB/YjiJ family MFS transporter [Rhodoplanes roseus]|uniref:MFS transporter n=1 Tax=Rhodoplanes roseus TaxID=29409 RepID=A0A327L4S6_9BRAD|nr:YbfB/YjiJ family MFS transporter [Rhodoplanes roseus]RAI44522.1 MFS transporter [Rhodoplanes roseus]
MDHPSSPSPPRDRPAVMAALAAMFVGIGLARFAYTPLLPAVIAAGWFGPDEAAYLGAANLGGYLLGAIGGRRLAPRASRTAPILMLITALTFVACAVPLPFAWFVGWRFVSGLTGGALMVIAAPAALRVVPAARRGLAGGVIFAGVGLGIAISGLMVPQLLRFGVGTAWAAIGILGAAVTVATWRGWPDDVPPSREHVAAASGRPWPPAATILLVVYGVIAAGLVPHMVFLVDFIARGLGAGIAAGSTWWAVFGVSATVGPAIFGLLADRVGFGNALAFALTLQIAAIGVLLVSTGPLALAVTSIVVGAYVPGSAPLVLGRLRELFHDPVRQQIAWSRGTIVFSLGQAAGAWLLSIVFARTGDHLVLFGFGTAAFVTALALDRVGALLDARSRRRNAG